MFGLNKYRVRDKKTERITRLIIVVLLLVVAFVCGVFYFRTNNLTNGTTTSGIITGSAGEQSGSYYSEETFSGSSEVFQQQVQTYLADFFQVEDLDYVTEDMMNEIAAQMTTSILNSLPANEITQDDWDKIESFVAEATVVAVTEWNNEHPATTSSSSSVSALTNEMKEYITNSISSTVSMEYQIYMGEIDDLKSSLTEQSVDYQKDAAQYNTLIENIQTTLTQIETTGATQDNISTLQSYIDDLSNTCKNYKSETSSDIASLETEMTSTKTALETAMQKQVDELKSVLITQIEENEKLSKEERESLASQIEALDAKNAEQLRDVLGTLREELTGSSENLSQALNDAINNWDSALAATNALLSETTAKEVEDLKDALIAQIKLDSTLSSQEKTAVIDKITNINAATTAELTNAITELYDELASTSTNQATALAGAINNWGTSLTATSTVLNNAIANAKSELANADSELSDLIQANKDAQDAINQSQADKNQAQDQINQSQSTTNGYLQNQITAITDGDEWIYNVTIAKADVRDDGSYEMSNSAFKTTSDVSIEYATKSGFTVKNYVLAEGKLTIYFTEKPTSDISVSQIHIQNQSQDVATP